MSLSIQDVKPGDYVKTTAGAMEKIKNLWGIGDDGSLAKPSEGGFGVETEDGDSVGMFEAASYHKAAEVDGPAKPSDDTAGDDDGDIGDDAEYSDDCGDSGDDAED